MRMWARVPNPHNEIKRLIFSQDDEGVYVFLSTSLEDEGCEYDDWYMSRADALESCEEVYGVTKKHWIDIGNPQPHCGIVYVRPVMCVQDPNVESGYLLKVFEDDEWKTFEPKVRSLHF